MSTIKINLFKSRWDAKADVLGSPASYKEIVVEEVHPEMQMVFQSAYATAYRNKLQGASPTQCRIVFGYTFFELWEVAIDRGDWETTIIVTGPSGWSFVRHWGDLPQFSAFLNAEIHKKLPDIE